MKTRNELNPYAILANVQTVLQHFWTDSKSNRA